jgi:hypothetical protein
VLAKIVVVASAVLWAEELRKLVAQRSRRRGAGTRLSAPPRLAAAR